MFTVHSVPAVHLTVAQGSTVLSHFISEHTIPPSAHEHQLQSSLNSSPLWYVTPLYTHGEPGVIQGAIFHTHAPTVVGEHVGVFWVPSGQIGAVGALPVQDVGSHVNVAVNGAH